MPIGIKGFQKGNKWGFGKHNQGRLGQKNSPEHRARISKAKKGKATPWMIGLKGEKSFGWKGGSHRWWRENVKKRDNYTCQICGLHDPEVVEADHIKPVAEYPELKSELSNGCTLCANCHRRKTNKENSIRGNGKN